MLSGIERLFSRSRPALGLDVGSHSVKLVELEKTGEQYELKRWVIHPLRDEAAEEKALARSREATLAAIREIYSTHGIQNRRVVTAVSGESVIVRIITIPFIPNQDEQMLQLSIQTEARDFIPFDMSDVAFDYQLLGISDRSGEQGQVQEVLIVAVKRDLVDTHVHLLREAQLDPYIVDVGAFALVNAYAECSNQISGESVALVNIGAEITSIAIVKDNATRFTRDLAIAGRNLTNALMSYLGKTREEAERIKSETGLGARSGEQDALSLTLEGNQYAQPDIVSDVTKALEGLGLGDEPIVGAEESGPPDQSRIAEVCEQILGDITSEVKRSLLFYENQLDGEPIGRIILSGGTAMLPNLCPFFEETLGVKTEIIRPLEKVVHQLSSEEEKNLSPLLGVAIGLALRSATR